MEDKSRTTCYFYCSDKSNDRNTAVSILKGLLAQLVRQNRELVPFCLEKKSNSGSPSLSIFAVAKSLLETICAVLPSIFVVIDGLDECQNAGDRRLILRALSDLVKTCNGDAQGKLRVLIFSRPLAEADRASLSSSIDQFSLVPENNASDIERYCKIRFREHGLQKLELETGEVETAVKITCTRANGKSSNMILSTNVSHPQFRYVPFRQTRIGQPREAAQQRMFLPRNGLGKVPN